MKTFKQVILFFTLSFCSINALLPPSEMKDLHQKSSYCMEKTGATDADMAVLMHSETPASQEGLCYAGCMAKKLGMLTDNNSINADRIKELASPMKDKNANKYDKLCTVIDKCASQVATLSNECAMAESLLKCTKTESENAGLHFTIFEILA